MKKKIIIYQSWLHPVGGVETFVYNWCWWLRNFFDIELLYCGGDPIRVGKMCRIVKCVKWEQDKTYECDIFIRNSVWGEKPYNVKAKKMVEMRHANYKFLLDKGVLYDQYSDMGIKDIVACGEYVAQMSDLVLHDSPTPIKNILLPPKETQPVIHFVSFTRIDADKGWKRMLKLGDMCREAGIRFDYKIFTGNPMKCDREEYSFWKNRYDIWDYLADATYLVLLSDSEGLPYCVQEALSYKIPCIVTDVGGCTELIKDGVNGYVVPLDMNFDIKKILNVPKCEEYDNHALEDWLKYLGYEGKITKEDINKIIENSKEEEIEMRYKVRALGTYRELNYSDAELGRIPEIGEKWEISEERLKVLAGDNKFKKAFVEVIELIKVEKGDSKATKEVKAEEDTTQEPTKATKKTRKSK